MNPDRSNNTASDFLFFGMVKQWQKLNPLGVVRFEMPSDSRMFHPLVRAIDDFRRDKPPQEHYSGLMPPMVVWGFLSVSSR
jgi:hypothetical protein